MMICSAAPSDEKFWRRCNSTLFQPVYPPISDERFKGWDEKYKQRVYRLDITIVASWDVLTRTDRVKYFLHPSWKAARSEDERSIDTRESNFKLKELIWGNFMRYAE